MSNIIKIRRGQDYTIELRGIPDSSGTLVAFSGSTLIFSLFLGSRVVLRKEITDFTGMVDGDADIPITNAESILLTSKDYYYQCDVIDSTSKEYPIVLGNKRGFGEEFIVNDFDV